MDLPSHALWTYVLEKAVAPEFIKTHRPFLFFSLLFAAFPDLITDAPYFIAILCSKNKLGLKSLKEVLNFAYDLNHNRSLEYEALFPWSARLGFFSHSFGVYFFIAIILNFACPLLFWPFVIGYGSHLLIDVPLHRGYFSSQPFYPFSQLTIPGWKDWYHIRNFQKYNYLLLAVCFIILITINHGL